MDDIGSPSKPHEFIALQWKIARERGQVDVGWWTLLLDDALLDGWDKKRGTVIPTYYMSPAFDSIGTYRMVTTEAYPWAGKVDIVSSYRG